MVKVVTDARTLVVNLYIATRKGNVEHRRYCIVCMLLIDWEFELSLSVPPKTRGYTAALDSVILNLTLQKLRRSGCTELSQIR